MGKIRVKTLGIEELEEEQKKKAHLESAKRAKEQKEKKKLAKAPGLKGGKGLVAVEPSQEELAKLDQKEESIERGELKAQKPTEKTKFAKKKARSKSYQNVVKLIEKDKKYPLSEALALLPKLKRAKFDETVELHINTFEKGVSGNLTLPHGTGKKVRVAIADDKLITEIEKGLPAGRQGKIDFDVLLATPEIMPKLARVAKFLGPRGLMPNSKNGTITNDPQKLALNFTKGQISFKTEQKAPVIHLTVGKLSLGNKKLLENIKTVLAAINANKIRNVTLKSTMSPGIKIDFTSATENK